MIKMGRHRSGAGVGGRSAKSPGSFLLSPSSIHFLSDHQSDIISHVLSKTDLDRNITDITRKIASSGDLPKIQAVQKDGHWFTLNNSQLELCRRLEKDGCCKQVKVDVVALTEVPVTLRGMMVLPQTDSVIQDPKMSKVSGDCLVSTALGDVSSLKDGAKGQLPQPRDAKDNIDSVQAQASLPNDSAPKEDGGQLECAGRTTGKGYQKLETADPGEAGSKGRDGAGAGGLQAGGEKVKGELSETSDDSDNSDDDSDSECDWSQDEGDSSDGKESGENHSTDDERECLL